MKIEEAIQQRSFKNEFHKAQINLLFTASWMQQLSGQALKAERISWQQFNILRILKGRHPEPASVTLLGERMIDRMSNASRLVEKLRKKGLVVRNTCPDDRRKANVSLTPKGMEVLEKASAQMEIAMEKTFNTISSMDARVLNDILDRIRAED